RIATCLQMCDSSHGTTYLSHVQVVRLARGLIKMGIPVDDFGRVLDMTTPEPTRPTYLRLFRDLVVKHLDADSSLIDHVKYLYYDKLDGKLAAKTDGPKWFPTLTPTEVVRHLLRYEVMASAPAFVRDVMGSIDD